MPIFEFRCQECRRRFSLLVGVVADGPERKCPRCGSASLEKLISRFSALKGEDAILDSLADQDMPEDMESPREMAQWIRKMSREMGEEAGDDFDELIEEAIAEEETAGASDGDNGASPLE
jgi:putative FmdB family regulatory protein